VPGFWWMLRMIGFLLLAGDCRSGLLLGVFYLSKENYFYATSLSDGGAVVGLSASLCPVPWTAVYF
jgi:hypothetical protein